MNEHEQLNDEEVIANELALEQEIYTAQQQLQNILNQGKAYGHPSIIKYFILFFLAIIIDAIDIVHLTGVLAVLAMFVSFFTWIAMILIYWFTDTKQKHAQKYVDNLQNEIEKIQLIIVHLTRLSLRTARLLRKVPGMKGVARQIPRILVKIRRTFRKNPITKVFIGGLINLVPFLAVIPWMVLGVLLAYLDERTIYKQAREAAESITETV